VVFGSPPPADKKGFISLDTHRQIISPQEFFIRWKFFTFPSEKSALSLEFACPAQLGAQSRIVVVIGHVDETEKPL